GGGGGNGDFPCGPNDPALSLLDGRFSVQVEFEGPNGEMGCGGVVPFGSRDSGLFYFFEPSNWEMLVKMNDACNSTFNSYWFFFAATTDVRYRVRVTDTVTGDFRDYENSLGTRSPAVTDTSAFMTCP
ncbi:MAG: hypothetical protein AAGM22_32365, partial [Acidobacteriota bacterium]